MIDYEDLIGEPYNFGECKTTSGTVKLTSNAWDTEHYAHLELRKEGEIISILVPEFVYPCKLGIKSEDCVIKADLSEILVDDFEFKCCKEYAHNIFMWVYDESNYGTNPVVRLSAIALINCEEKSIYFCPALKSHLHIETKPSAYQVPLGVVNTVLTFEVAGEGQAPANEISIEDKPEKNTGASEPPPKEEIGLDADEDGMIEDDEMEWKSVKIETLAFCATWNSMAHMITVTAAKNENTGERRVYIPKTLFKIHQVTNARLNYDASVMKIEAQKICEYFDPENKVGFPSGSLNNTKSFGVYIYNPANSSYRSITNGIAYYYDGELVIAPDDENTRLFEPVTDQSIPINITIGLAEDICLVFNKPNELPEYENLRPELEDIDLGEDEGIDYIDEDDDDDDDMEIIGGSHTERCSVYLTAWVEDYTQCDITFIRDDENGKGKIIFPDILFKPKTYVYGFDKYHRMEIDLNEIDLINFLGYNFFPAKEFATVDIEKMSGGLNVDSKGKIYFFNGKLIVSPVMSNPENENENAYFHEAPPETNTTNMLIGLKATTVEFDIPYSIVDYVDVHPEYEMIEEETFEKQMTWECFAGCDAWVNKLNEAPITLQMNETDGKARLLVPLIAYDAAEKVDDDEENKYHIEITLDKEIFSAFMGKWYFPSGSLGNIRVISCNHSLFGVAYIKEEGKLIVVPDGESYKYFEKKTPGAEDKFVGIESYTALEIQLVEDDVVYEDLRNENPEQVPSEYPKKISYECTYICKAWECGKLMTIVFTLINDLGQLKIGISSQKNPPIIINEESDEKYTLQISIPENVNSFINGFYFPNLITDTIMVSYYDTTDNYTYKTERGILYYYEGKFLVAPGTINNKKYFSPGKNTFLHTEEIGIAENLEITIDLLSEMPEYIDYRSIDEPEVPLYPQTKQAYCTTSCDAWGDEVILSEQFEFKLNDAEGNLEITIPELLSAPAIATDSNYGSYLMTVTLPTEVNDFLEGYYFPNIVATKNKNNQDFKVQIVDNAADTLLETEGFIYYYDGKLYIAPGSSNRGSRYKYFTRIKENLNFGDIPTLIGVNGPLTISLKLLKEKPSYINYRPTEKYEGRYQIVAQCDAWETNIQVILGDMYIDENNEVIFEFESIKGVLKDQIDGKPLVGSPIILNIIDVVWESKFRGYVPAELGVWESTGDGAYFYGPTKYITEDNYRIVPSSAYYYDNKFYIFPGDEIYRNFFPQPTNYLYSTEIGVGIYGGFAIHFTPVAEKPIYTKDPKHNGYIVNDTQLVPRDLEDNFYVKTWANINAASVIPSVMLLFSWDGFNQETQKNILEATLYPFTLPFNNSGNITDDCIQIDVSNYPEILNNNTDTFSVDCTCCLCMIEGTDKTVKCKISYLKTLDKLLIKPYQIIDADNTAVNGFKDFVSQISSITVHETTWTFETIKNMPDVDMT